MSIFNKKNYVIAVSGGPDSIALLHMYHKYVKAVCTVKYNKRLDCQYDVECVKKLTNKYNLPLELLDVDDSMYEEIKENNFQNKARIIRYNFFKKIAKKYNTNKILVAHHLDDFIETAYMQKKINSNLYFYGIKDVSILDNEFEIHRPLIRKYRKSTLERYCNDYNLDYAIDSSNNLDSYERNRIRKIISHWDTNKIRQFLDEIDKYNKQKHKELLELEKHYKKWSLVLFDVRLFKTYSKDIQIKLIYKFLEENKIYRPNKNKINGIIDFINGMNGKFYRINDNINLIKSNHCIELKENNNVN